MAAGDGPVGVEMLQVKQFFKLFRISTNGIGEVDLDLGFWQCQNGDRRTPAHSQVGIKKKKKKLPSRSKKKCGDKDTTNDYREEEIAILPAPRN